MLYLDTSLLIAFATLESETGRIQSWMQRQSGRQLATSDWTVTEFSSGLSVKLRSKTLTGDQRDCALSLFRQEFLGVATRLSVVPQDFSKAADFADSHDLGLRAGDALHLAIAARQRATLCTLDRKQAEAGATLGIDTMLV